jgi:ketosteroid isomerase-like protein
MPSGNRLILHRLYQALQARDYPTLFEFLSPEIRITYPPQLRWGVTFQGHDGAKEFFERLGTFVTSHVAIERILDVGDQMAVTVWTGTTRRAGRRFAVPITYLWEFKDGLGVSLDVALDARMLRVPPADAA